MWEFKRFKTHEAMTKWIEKNKHRYRIDECFVNNGYGVEYKPLITIL